LNMLAVKRELICFVATLQIGGYFGLASTASSSLKQACASTNR
jgi:hypothetical protein